MSESQTMDADPFRIWLVEQDSDRVLRWLSEVGEGIRQPPGGLNWLGLAEMSPNLALKKDDVGWACVAVQVNISLIHEARTHGHVFFSARIVLSTPPRT
jgi:hypothetical protein